VKQTRQNVLFHDLLLENNVAPETGAFFGQNNPPAGDMIGKIRSIIKPPKY
jgi:hypothetical protein